jgi:hypothetical protein
MNFDDQCRLANMLIVTRPDTTIKEYLAEISEFDRKQRRNEMDRRAWQVRIKRQHEKQTA